ncbi:MAG: hypothetical protein NTW46_02505 [Candidatus Nealsonbacteria bacterium]|nr:hypothetical protein [Candidatus Nealsonbacteria bacterium]
MNGNKKILNFDKEKAMIDKNCLSYGFNEGADVRATDINIDNSGSNFKVNYKGNTVPFWAKGAFDADHIYIVLKSIAEAIMEGKNLVEISNNIKTAL